MSPELQLRGTDSADVEHLARLDASYSTDRIYVVERTELAFRLVERRLEEPFSKAYSFAPTELTHVAVANGQVAGACGVALEEWNGRMRLEHLYVASAWRRRGVGAALVEAAAEAARNVRARVLWCETQNVNPDAVDFYRSRGFALVGLDLSLYDDGADEAALFLARDV